MGIKAILAILGAAVVVVIAVKFGKAILKVALILAVLVLGCWLAFRGMTIEGITAEGVTLDNVATIAQAVRPQREAQPQPSSGGYWKGFWSGVFAGALGIVALAACVVAGFYYLRWRFGNPQPVQQPRRRRQVARSEPQRVVVDEWGWEDEDRDDDITGLGLEDWGF